MLPRARIQIACALAGIVAASQAGAQAHSSRQLAVSAGMLAYDASGTGETYTVAVRANQAIRGRWLGIELGLAYAPLDEQFRTEPTRIAALDVQLQLQLPTTRVQPYLGLGPGLVTYLTQAGGRDWVAPAGSGGIGVRVNFGPSVGAVLDGRIRGWNFAGATDWAVNAGGELTTGLSYRF